MKKLMLLGLFMLVSGVSQSVHAACALIKPSDVNYGNISSVTVNSTPLTQNFAIELYCNTLLAVLSQGSIRITLVSTAPAFSPRPMLSNISNSDRIPTQFVCATPNCAANTEVPVGQWVTFNTSTLLTLLSNKTFRMNFATQTLAGQSVMAGTYNTTLNLKVEWSICSVALLNLLCLTPDTGNETFQLPVSIKVENDCTSITAPDINFGNAPLASSFADVTGTVTLVCTKGSPYSVGISDGMNSVSGVRHMKNEQSDLLAYDIYQSSTNNRWGSLPGQRWSSIAASTSGSDQMTKTYNYTAKILSQQATRSAGHYEDTLVIDVVF